MSPARRHGTWNHVDMLPTHRDHAGPNPVRLARHNGAEYRQHCLLDELSRRPPRPKRASSPKPAPQPPDQRGALLASAKAKLQDPAAVAALEAVVTSAPFEGLREGIQRGLLKSIGSPALVGALQRIVPAVAAADRRTQTALLEAFVEALDRGPVAEVVLRMATCPLFATFDGAEKRHALRLVLGPSAQAFSWNGHQPLLDQWWLRNQRGLQAALGEHVEAARKAWDAFVHEPKMPVYLLKSDAFPGVVLLVVGSPDDPHALAYARIFFLDEQERLQVGLKSPVEPIRGGWSPKVDPNGVEYRFRRTHMSLDETLAFVRWVEENHSVSGPGGLHRPQTSQRAVYDGLIQFDLRAPKMVEMICGHRGPVEWVEGSMRRGRVVAQRQAA